MVLTGGLDTFNDIFMYMCFSKTPALSPTGDAPAVRRRGDGTILGEGLGMLVLKRLADAERDGDRIYAVIRGVGSSSDGKGKSIYAPSAGARRGRCARAYERAGVAPDDVELVEAHGTGHDRGDATELEALRRGLPRRQAERRRWSRSASVKSQIGHTKAAAGAAGLIKAALALHHKVLPPTIKVTQPEPGRRLRRARRSTSTPRPGPGCAAPAATAARRRERFGFGGSNFHFVLEEHEPEQARPIPPARRSPGRSCSTRPAGRAAERCRRERALARPARRPGRGRGRCRRPIGRGTRPSAARVGAWSPRSADEARALLDLAAGEIAPARRRGVGASAGRPLPAAGARAGGRVAALFPGQGSQYVGHGPRAGARVPVGPRTRSRRSTRGLAEAGEPPLSATPSSRRRPSTTPSRRGREEALRRTDRAQPAIGALSAGALPASCAAPASSRTSLAGHSFGELTALWAADALDDATFVDLTLARGRAMAGAPEEGDGARRQRGPPTRARRGRRAPAVR